MDPLLLPAWLVLVLVALAAARLWRLIAVDAIADPLRRRLRVEIADAPKQWRDTLSYLIQCPFCAGFWISGMVLASALAWSDTVLWQLVAGTCAVNYVQAHLNAWLDVEA